jgi:serine/threonine-protein kinase HipA
VSLPKIVNALRELPLNGKDLLNFQRWVVFNYLIGNSDAHAKNISILISHAGFALAPFYDLLCVQVYGDNHLALYIGDEDTYDSIGSHSWEAFCDDCGFGLKPTLANFKKMALDLPKAWQTITNSAIKQLSLSNEETTLIQSMTDIFQKNCSAAISMT